MKTMSLRRFPGFLTVAALMGLSAAVAYGAGKVNFNDNIAPIFRNSCTNCHNPDKKKAGLDLTSYSTAMEGGESGPPVKPGNPDGSLIYRVTMQIDDPKMPPKGDKLSEADLKTIKEWIAGFALETANSKPAAPTANKVEVAVVSLTKPDGPPPMPGDLPLEPFTHPKAGNAIVAMASSPWAPLVAVGGQEQVVLYNAETTNPLGVLAFPEGYPNVIRFSRNSKVLLAAGGFGGKSGKVVLWNVETGERIGTVGNETDSVLAADLSPDQQYVALGGADRKVKIYRTKDGKQTGLIKKHTDWVTAIAYSPDGKYLATADRNGGVEVWESGPEPKPFNTLAGHKSACTALAFMPGVLASGGEDGKIILWNVKEGTEIKSWGAHGGGVEWVEFSPDGRLASCGRDKVAKVWDQTGKQLASTEAFNDLATRCTLNNDRFVAADWTGDIRVYGMDGKKVGTLTANPPGISEQLGAAGKAAAEAAAALPAAQKAVTDAEARVKAEQAAAEAKLKADLAAAEAKKAEAARHLEEAKAIEGAAEKSANEANAQVAPAKDAVARAEAALAEKQKGSSAGDGAGAAELAAAQKKLDELNTELAKRREARSKVKEGTPEYAKANDAVQGIKPEIAKAGQAVAAAQARVGAPKVNPAEVEAAKKAVAEARQKFEAAEQQAKKAQKDLNEARNAAPKRVAEAEKAVAAADGELNKLKNPPAPAASPKVAELEKRLQQLNAEMAAARDQRAKVKEGTPEYAKANEAVQSKKLAIEKAGQELAEAKKSAPGPKPTDTEQALAKAKAELEALNAKAASAKAEAERWKRAQDYQTVFDARQDVAAKQSKYDDLVATAKDAFRPVELAKQSLAEAQKAVADGPKLVAEKEAALAELKKSAEAAKAALDAANKAVEDKKKEPVEKERVEAQIKDLQKQVESLSQERDKLREERQKHPDGSPEFKAIQEKREGVKAQIGKLQAQIEAAKSRLDPKAAAPAVPPELVEAVKKAELDLHLAKTKLPDAEKAVEAAKKAVAEAAKQVPELQARLPQLQADGVKTKADAEKEAAALARELQAAKVQAEKLRAQYEASKKTAANAPAAAAPAELTAKK